MTRAVHATALSAILVCAGAGCATYTENVDVARQLVSRGDYEAALVHIDSLLGLRSPDEVPAEWGAETALAMLERASLLQALGDYRGSARDITAAETELEFLDLHKDTPGKIGKYIYSDSAEVYRVLPTEQLSLSGVNMLNYLAMGDLAGARVEARRFTVTRNYLIEAAPDRSHAPFLSYLAGFVFEHLGSAEEALRYYDEALQRRSYESLSDPVARLSRMTAYRGKAIEGYLASHPDADASAPPAGTGELLVVVGLGRVPYKVPERLPIGAAVGIAATWITWDTRILERSALKFVVYPKLVPSGSRARSAAVSIDGRSVLVEQASNVGAAIANEYEVLKPKILAAALTRMAARAGASEGARAAARSNSKGTGILAALAVEGILTGLDKPDTRSWNLLPDTVLVSRVRVPAGRRKLRILVDAGERIEHACGVDVPPGGFAVVPVMELR